MSAGRSSAALLAGRIVLLAAAAGATWAAFAVRRGGGEGAAPAAAGGAAVFSCPMHPEVVSEIGADCPICNMALEIRKPAAPPLRATLVLSPGTFPLPEVDVGVAKRRRFNERVTAPAWIEPDGGGGWALLHRGDWKPELAARFVPVSGPSRAFDVQLSREPPVVWDAALLRVRFEPTPRPTAAETGWLELGEVAFDIVTVPLSAVVESAAGQHVFVASADRRSFVLRKIETGRTLSGFASVLSGLADGERVVIASAFFLAAEQRLQLIPGRGTEAPP